MRRLAIIATGMLSAAAASGQGLLDCVDPDVLRALLLQGQGERPQTFSAAVPSEFGSLTMPAGFAWIGSSERVIGQVDASTTASQITAAWRTSLAPESARAAAATALTASGWELRPMPGFGPNVFNSRATQPALPACRDGQAINMNAAAMDGVTYVTLSAQRGSNNNSICSMQMRVAPTLNAGFARYLPRIDLPVDAATGYSLGMRSGSASARAGSATYRAEFFGSDSPGEIARQFSRQIAEQGWSNDASWSGADTAGSSWSRPGESGTVIQGTLTVTAVDERQFVAVFRVLNLQ